MRHVWLGLGVAEMLLLATLAKAPAAHAFPWPGLAVFGGAFLAYAAAAWTFSRWSSDKGPHGMDEPPRHGRVRTLLADPRVAIWLLAIVVRLLLVSSPPELSDDFYRYLWDGQVQAAGINPYEHAPDAPALDGIDSTARADVNNPSVPTIYPPFAQLVFLLLALAGSGVTLMKLVWVACDLATGWVLARTARDRGVDDRTVLLLWLWSPLLVVEVAWSGHLESLGLLVLALAIRFADQKGGRAAAAGVALALATLTKFAPAAALPALVRQRGVPAAIGFLATVTLLYVPYADAGFALFTGLRTYGEHWWFMKGPFTLLELATGDPAAARRAAGAIVIGVIGWTAGRAYPLDRTLLWVLGAGMILTPTLHPWYVLWMLPMAVLRGNRAWLLLSGLAFTGYFGLGGYQDSGEWVQPVLSRAVMWMPFLGLLMWDALGAWRRGDDAGVRP